MNPRQCRMSHRREQARRLLQGRIPATTRRNGVPRWWKVALPVAIAIPAVVLRLSGAHIAPTAAVPVFGFAVVAASFLLVWAAEAAQHDISGNLATAILAVIAVLPEYAVDLYFGWSAGHIPENARYAAANMTGSNRLLLWLGWPFVALLFAWGLRRRGEQPRGLELHEGRKLELAFLALASLYSLIIPFPRRLAWYDGVVLLAVFAIYLWRAAHGERREPELIGVARQLGELPTMPRRIAVSALFIAAGAIVLMAAEPFAVALVAGGKQFGFDE